MRSEGKAFGAAAPIPYQVLRAVELHGWGDQSCSIKSFGARSIVYALTDEGVANRPAFVGDLKASTDDFFAATIDCPTRRPFLSEGCRLIVDTEKPVKSRSDHDSAEQISFFYEAVEAQAS